jgi:ATP-binding cassette, subfamily B, bacterial
MISQKYTDRMLYRRILREAREYRFHILGVLLVDLLASPLGLLAPLPLKIVVDNAIGGHPLPRLWGAILPDAITASRSGILGFALGLLVLITGLSHLQALGSVLLRAYTGERLLLGFRAKVFGHIQRMSVSYHDMKGTSDSVYRIQYDTAAIQYISIDGVIPFLTAGFSLMAMLWVTLRLDWQLALVAMGVSPVLFYFSQSYRPRLRLRSRELKQFESSAMSVLQEVLAVIRVVKAFGREDHEQERFVRHSADSMRARIRLALIEGSYGLSVGLTTAIGTASVIWIGVHHIGSGRLTLGDLLLVIAYVGQLYEPLKLIGKKASSLQGHLASAERAFSVIDMATDVPEKPDATPIRRARGEIHFHDVSFAYDAEHPVVENVSFSIPRGARVGIAGRTGAGKTTLLSLLTRFYDPTKGQILLDSTDLREYRLADLRNQFAIVLQEPVLFSTSIGENIAYARPDATEEEIMRAARLADAHEFIQALPEGYRTLVGERGMRLSGGERQRISLARAFLKDAPILLLDEPTSSVDVKTESTIMEALERLMQDRTTFIIAHRLSTLDSCDIRLEIKNGRVSHVPPGTGEVTASLGAARGMGANG